MWTSDLPVPFISLLGLAFAAGLVATAATTSAIFQHRDATLPHVSLARRSFAADTIFIAW